MISPELQETRYGFFLNAIPETPKIPQLQIFGLSYAKSAAAGQIKGRWIKSIGQQTRNSLFF